MAIELGPDDFIEEYVSGYTQNFAVIAVNTRTQEKVYARCAE